MTVWVAALGAAFTAGILVGSFLRRSSDRWELAAYRRFARLPPEEILRLLKAARTEATEAAQAHHAR